MGDESILYGLRSGFSRKPTSLDQKYKKAFRERTV